jgi:hypothetical protein
MPISGSGSCGHWLQGQFSTNLLRDDDTACALDALGEELDRIQRLAA